MTPHPMTCLASPNHGPREPGTTIDMLVLHYTGMKTGQDALQRLCDPSAQVSAHYVVLEDGHILQLVAEDQRAWHAGVSSWRGKTDVNNRSVGVEIVNPGHEFGYRPFPAAQMAAVVGLCRAILGRHPGIPPRNVVGHSDVAPWRKEDPGELFDWPGLSQAGVGIYPAARHICAAPADGSAADLLTAIGYRVDDASGDLEAVIRAFQRRFYPTHLSGHADAQTLQRLHAVLRLCEASA